jgi:hypothetical protein
MCLLPTYLTSGRSNCNHVLNFINIYAWGLTYLGTWALGHFTPVGLFSMSHPLLQGLLRIPDRSFLQVCTDYKCFYIFGYVCRCSCEACKADLFILYSNTVRYLLFEYWQSKLWIWSSMLGVGRVVNDPPPIKKAIVTKPKGGQDSSRTVAP